MDLLSLFSFRSIILFASTAFSMMLVMLVLNIITVDEIIVILKLSPESANAIKMVILRIQEVTSNIVVIISQLLGKLLSFAGVNVDLTKIKVDLHQSSTPPSAVESVNPPATVPAQQ